MAGVSDVACTAFIGVGDDEMSGCVDKWTLEKSGSGDFDDPQPKSDNDRFCCHFDEHG